MAKIIDSLELEISKLHWENMTAQAQGAIKELLQAGATPGEIEQEMKRITASAYPTMLPHKVREVAARFYLAANYCRHYILNNEPDGPDPDPAGDHLDELHANAPTPYDP